MPNGPEDYLDIPFRLVLECSNWGTGEIPAGCPGGTSTSGMSPDVGRTKIYGAASNRLRWKEKSYPFDQRKSACLLSTGMKETGFHYAVAATSIAAMPGNRLESPVLVPGPIPAPANYPRVAAAIAIKG